MSRNVQWVSGLALALLLIGGAVGLHLRQEPQPVSAPAPVSCSVRLLSPAERRQHLQTALADQGSPLHSLPGELADNPMVFFAGHAIVRIENATPAPLYFHSLSRERTAIIPGQVFLREVELFDTAGQKLVLAPETEKERITLLADNPRRIPTAEELSRREKPSLYGLPGHTAIELPVNILDHWSQPQYGLKPGTYTARVTVSFAEAPSGEARQIVCEPVAVTVTEEQIKAAKAYWTPGSK